MTISDAGPVSTSLRLAFVQNTAIQVIGHAVSMTVGFVVAAMLSRYLGVSRFGEFNFIFAFAYLLLTVNDLGISSIVAREIAKDPTRAKRMLDAMLVFRLAVSVVTVGVGVIVVWLMQYRGEIRGALITYSLIVPVTALQIRSVLFQVQLSMDRVVLSNVTSRAAALLFVLIVIRLHGGLEMLAGAFVIAEVIGTSVLYLDRADVVAPGLRADAAIWGEILRGSAPIAATIFFVALINRIDFFMIERLSTARELGLYAAAYKFTNLLEAFPLLVMTSVAPVMARYAIAERSALSRLYWNSTATLASIGIIAGIIVTFSARVMLRIAFGAAFAAGGPALQVLVWSTVCLYAALPGGNLLIAMNLQRISLILNAIGAALNITLNLYTIPRWGAVGAAAVTTATYLMILIGTVMSCRAALRAAPEGLKHV